MTLAQFDQLDDAEREWWIAEWELDNERCSCGRLLSECSDPHKQWYPQRVVCYATMEKEAAIALYGRLHEDKPYHDGTFSSWSAKPTADCPYHYSSGVTIFVAPVDFNPDDNFLSSSSEVRHRDEA